MPHQQFRSDNRSHHPSLYTTSTSKADGDAAAGPSFSTDVDEPYPFASASRAGNRSHTRIHSPPSSPFRDTRSRSMDSNLRNPSTGVLKQHHRNVQYTHGRSSPAPSNRSPNVFSPNSSRLSNNRPSTYARPDNVEILHLIDPSYSGLVPSTSTLSVNNNAADSFHAARRGSPIPPPAFSKAYVDAQGRLHDPDYRAFDVDFAPNSRSPRSSSRQHNRQFEERGTGTRQSSEVGLLVAGEIGRRSHVSPSYRESMTLEDDEDDGADYDSDADVTLTRQIESSFSPPMTHSASSTPVNTTSRRYSKANTTGSDSGYAGTAPTSSPLNLETPSSSPPEHTGTGVATDSSARPRPTRELSRNTLYPRTPATRYFSSQLQTNVIQRAQPSLPPLSISQPSTSSSSMNDDLGSLGMPGMREKDDPYRKIVVVDTDREQRAMTPTANASSHLHPGSHHLRQPGIEGNKNKKKRSETSIREKHKLPEEDVSSSAILEKQPSIGALRRSRRIYPASSTGLPLADHPTNAVDYIPSHHGKAKSLRPGAEPLQADDFTCACLLYSVLNYP